MARFIGTIAVGIRALFKHPVRAGHHDCRPRHLHRLVDAQPRLAPRRLRTGIVFKDEGGKVIAEMSNQMQPETQKVTDITKSGSDVVLKFAGNFQGNPFDAAITLTPDGTDKCKVTFDVNGGQFTMSGTGTKK